ncbi:glycine cleavage system aminomethyltransferase GcvT [Entomobacter blattae]|uniref:aminomethyltransferase n=1 Tax=Entomobacter blattae TaxID=2762277 RepID=A0A7H1NSZ4_9PROT|nr:glycine cleavage system aminomethyltransferase GcvT [Entomobacter blattae]QNT78904.1 Aminomethyltransferase [Entomobacter blattae]
MTTLSSPLQRTPLYNLHKELGARFVPFAGYEMPVHYEDGIIAEHLHTRNSAGFFDISHMGQMAITHKSSNIDFSFTNENKSLPHEPISDILLKLERLLPADIKGLKSGRQRYSTFTNTQGGILDDLMVANLEHFVFLVVNAACRNKDFTHVFEHMSEYSVKMLDEKVLFALQGPKADSVLSRFVSQISNMKFMDIYEVKDRDGVPLLISRSGYTGEDGFEISLNAVDAEPFARKLLTHKDVKPVGLGARDSLRLEAGLCLYGHDITEKTTPVEAALEWSIQKVRRKGGARAGGFPGERSILDQLEQGTALRRVGLKSQGRAPVRESAKLFADDQGQNPIGHVTSGTFSPSLSCAIAMGYVQSSFSIVGNTVYAELRGKFLPFEITPLPFVTSHYKR